MSEELGRQLGMIYEKVMSIERILRSSPLGDATRAAEAREASHARAIARGIAEREARAGRSSGGAGASAGELKTINGDFYWVSNGNVYEYDQIEGRAGAFVGRLKADGKSFNASAKEVLGGGFRKTRRSSSKNRKTQNRSRRH